jgi:hypothetical protein
MEQIQLKYNTSSTVNLDVLAVRGAAEPDQVSKFGVTHEFLNGFISEQLLGGRREISIDFQVMTPKNRRQVVDWYLDESRQLVCLASAPTVTPTLASGGSLTNGTTYYYKVCTIDVLGHSAASSEVSETASNPNLTINLAWAAVSNARCYKIYRKAAVGGTYYIYDYTTTNSYSDTGTATALRAETAPTTATAISVIVPDMLGFSWAEGTELARMLSISVRESSIFTSSAGFPV